MQNRVITFAESTIRINGLCLWCARRAVAFAAISMGYQNQLKDKVHFDPKVQLEKKRITSPACLS